LGILIATNVFIILLDMSVRSVQVRGDTQSFNGKSAPPTPPPPTTKQARTILNSYRHVRTKHPEKLADDPALQHVFVQRGKPAQEGEHIKNTSTNTAAIDARTESSLLKKNEASLLPP
jgi:hypothetical protein